MLLAMAVIAWLAIIGTVVALVIIKSVKRDLLNDRDDLIKRVDDPYKTDYWNQQ